jgi:hypothetical protein
MKNKMIKTFGDFEFSATPMQFGSWYEIIKKCVINGIEYRPVQHSGFNKAYAMKCWKKIVAGGVDSK